MTSVLNVDTIADKAGTGPVGLTKQAAAKQFLVADYTNFSIGTSLNVSSVTDRGTGLGTVNTVNVFSSVNRAGASQASFTTASDGADNYNSTSTFIRNGSNTSQNFMNAWHQNGSLYDMENVSGAMFGDLA